MKTIITLTPNPSIDANTSTDHVIAEQKLRCENLVFEPGGGGVNVSRAPRESRVYLVKPNLREFRELVGWDLQGGVELNHPDRAGRRLCG